MDYRNDKKTIKEVEVRIKIAHIIIIGLFILVIGYLFLLQIFDIRHYRPRVERQRHSKTFVMRGQILDRNGIRLAVDKTSYNLYLHRDYFDHEPEEIAEMLAPVLQMEKKTIVKAIEKGSTVILLKKDVDGKTVAEVKKLGLREVCIDKKK